METVQSFKGYGKVDEVEEQAFRKKTRKRLIILTISLLVLMLLVIGVLVGTLVHKSKSDEVSATTIKSICTVTQYPDSCFTSLLSSNTSDPKTIFQFSLKLVFDSLNKISTFPNDYKNRTNNPSVKAALNVCDTVLDDALSTLNDSISSLHLEDLKTWLSTVVTDQETCFEALEEVNATFVDEIKVLMRNSTEFSSNSLAIATKFLGMLEDFKIPIHRKLMSESVWRLLQESMPSPPNVTVAKDGSGNVSTINEAVDLIPLKSNVRFVIYVKAGEYLENVILDKAHWNVMIYGDGKNTTFVSGNKNFIDGTPTFSTATFAVAGRGFIARDISFINTAGAIKHQAVALRSGSDQSVFYRCSFDSFQDTLYAHSNRQFYRDCDITGTIDFIFGNSAVVFQNCNILPRQPLSNQFVTITAQGKKDPNQNTGISIQRCTMTPLDNLTAPTYLGRPWKDYSTTVIMQTSIGGFLNPKGWISWVPNVDPPKSIIYAEYQNTGLGASTSNRVAWAGYKATLTAVEASNYNVQSFIQGPSWLPATSVDFDTT